MDDRVPAERRSRPKRVARDAALVVAAIALVGACSDSPTAPFSDCTIPLAEFVDGGAERSDIPALANPHVVRPNTPGSAFIPEFDLVIGVIFNGQPLAIPHRILWHHEVVNLSVPGEQLAVTYSPLTGSGLVFDRGASSIDSFSVSRYVLGSNLVMEDAGGTLWPQMIGTGSCGSRDGVHLARVPYEELSYAAWFATHQDTWVVSSGTGYDFLYTLYPYGDYEDPDNATFEFPIEGELDTRRPPKERVLGIPSSSGGLAVPLSILDALRPDQSPVSVGNAQLDGRPIAVFWNFFARAAIPFRAEVDGQTLTFEAVGAERRDIETGSSWDLFGAAYAGPLAGTQLERVPDTYVAFWFAWAEFNPDTEVWSPPVPASVSASFGVAPALPPGPIDPALVIR